MKVLNLYCGIGGNRKNWPDDEIDVTAIEINPEIAKIYQESYYKPLIKPFGVMRHHFWSNFNIPPNDNFKQIAIGYSEVKELQKFHDINLSKYKLPNKLKRKILRNCVIPELGRYIFEKAKKNIFKGDENLLCYM